MLLPKFNYAKLERVDTLEGRRYVTPTGHALPSVTTILSATQSKEKTEILENWRDAVGAEKAKEITSEAANRGTRMHSYLEKYVLESALPKCGTNPYAQISHSMALTVIEKGLKNVTEYWGSEVGLYYPEIYAGTTDLVGCWKGVPAILDFKQSNKIKTKDQIEDYFCQLVMYGLAHNKVYGTNINTGVILMCVKPQVDARLKIVEPPTYLEFVLQGKEWDYYERITWDRIESYYANTV